jgi:hypothetical protein
MRVVFGNADSTGLSAPARSGDASERGEKVEFDAERTEGTEFGRQRDEGEQIGGVMDGGEGEGEENMGKVSMLLAGR